MSPEKHRKTTGQWSGLCSSCKVVWETLGPRWEVSSREVGKQKERKRSERHSPFISLLGEGNDIQQCPFHPIVRKHKNEKWKGGTRKKRGTTAERRGKIQYNICFVITNYLIIIIMRK